MISPLQPTFAAATTIPPGPAGGGGYEPVAERLFAHENVDAYYLEFDDARSGGFEPLRFVTPGKSRFGTDYVQAPELEDKDAVIARIHEGCKVCAAREPLPSARSAALLPA